MTSEHGVHVQPGALAEGERFGEALHQAGDADLVDHLGQLPGCRWGRAR
jgi:hypothetical protein